MKEPEAEQLRESNTNIHQETLRALVFFDSALKDTKAPFSGPKWSKMSIKIWFLV